MSGIRWSRQSVDDVEAIKSYIARDSKRYAQTVAERIVAAVERLNDYPRSGRVVPEFAREEIREIVYNNYRIIYRFHDDTVEIVTVFHGAMMPRFSIDD